MTANNPLLKSAALRRRLFVSYPDDLRPSPLAKAMAHAGTFLEFATPLTLLFVTHSGPLLFVGMVFALMLHGFILSNLPIAAVFEWNVLSIYAAFFLFVGHPEVSLFAVGSLPLDALPGGRAARPAADRQPDAVEGLLPGGDALLRRATGRGTRGCFATAASGSSTR